jgi:hypothetical protein
MHAAHSERFPRQIEREMPITECLRGNAPFIPVDSESCHLAFMFPSHKEPTITGGGHDDRWDRQLLTLWNDVHRMQ